MGKKVIVIGGGVSGIASATYLQKNGYEALVLEKNPMLGGACMGWDRHGCHIDGCIHWLVGANPKSPTYKLWEETGALNPEIGIYNIENFCTIDFGDGKIISMYADLEKFEKELIAFAPEDEKEIKKLCKLVKRFERINAPCEKPADLMNLGDLLKIAFTMAGDYFLVEKYSKVDCKDYAKKFKNPFVRKWIAEQVIADYNFMTFLFMYAHCTAKDGGIPIGGSLEMVNRMVAYAKSLGAQFRSGVEVEKVDVENGKAVGVTLKNGEKLSADWVISATPVEYTLKNLLGGKYAVESVDERVKDRKVYPVYTFTTAVFKVNADLSNDYISHKIYVDEPISMEKEHYSATFRNYSYDKTLKAPDGYCVVQGALGGNDDMYFWWEKVKQEGNYQEKKKEVAQKLLDIYLTRYPHLKGKIEIIDVLTPLTYQRYLNGRNGSFQGFVHTAKGKSMMQKGEIKGLKNFILSGQWLISVGGLPVAAMTGKFSVQRICKKDGVKFKS